MSVISGVLYKNVQLFASSQVSDHCPLGYLLEFNISLKNWSLDCETRISLFY